jgi:predicted MPP superfamily phosphohydrolase
MSRKKLRTVVWLVLWLIAVIIIVVINYYNRHLIITNYKINDPRWPAALNSWRLVQLSDIHNQATEGPGNNQIISSVQKLQPDIITITGDLFDGDRTNIPNNLQLVKELTSIAPVYMVLGNHEFANDDYIKLIQLVEEAGAQVMRNELVTINDPGAPITIIGLDDPAAWGWPLSYKAQEQLTAKTLNKIMALPEFNSTSPRLILAHRPELWPQYLLADPLVILSGHTHGGQIRLPLIGAIYVPNQPLLAQYDEGIFTKANSYLIISRGLGNSFINCRFDNYPQIVTIDFYHK